LFLKKKGLLVSCAGVFIGGWRLVPGCRMKDGTRLSFYYYFLCYHEMNAFTFALQQKLGKRRIDHK